MTLSCDFVSYHIQQHSTKFIDCTYLSPCSWRLTFSVHQNSFIYYWESASYIAFVEKPTSCYPICWDAHPIAVSISTHQYPICWDATFFNLILLRFGPPLIALQLRADDTFINPFSSQVGDLRCGEEASSIHTKL